MTKTVEISVFCLSTSYSESWFTFIEDQSDAFRPRNVAAEQCCDAPEEMTYVKLTHLRQLPVVVFQNKTLLMFGDFLHTTNESLILHINI